MLFNTPLPGKRLQQVAKPYSFSTAPLPAHAPFPKSPNHPTQADVQAAEMAQQQSLSGQQQMLKQKLQQQTLCEQPSARAWRVLGFLPEPMTCKWVTEQGQASWNSSLNYVDACIARNSRQCNCLMSLLYSWREKPGYPLPRVDRWVLELGFKKKK